MSESTTTTMTEPNNTEVTTLYKCESEYWNGILSKPFRCIIGYLILLVQFAAHNWDIETNLDFFCSA